MGSIRPSRWTPYLLFAPAIVLFLFVFAIPWANSLVISFESYSLQNFAQIGQFVGLQNYQTTLHDPVFAKAVINSLIYTVALVGLSLLFGILIALVIFSPFRGQRLVLVVFTMPLLIAPSIAGLMWKQILEPGFGPVDYFLHSLGLPVVDWFGNPHLTLMSVVIVGLWGNVSFITLITSAGLHAIPRSQFESAQIDGASHWGTFRYVTFSWLRPLITIAVIFSVIGALRTFDTVFVAIGPDGGPDNAALMLGNYLYYSDFTYFNIGAGSAVSWMLLLLTVAIGSVFAWSLLRKMKM